MVIPSFGLGRLCGKYHRFSGFAQWSSPGLAWVGYVGSIIPSFFMGRLCGKYHLFSGFPRRSSPVLAWVGYVGSFLVLVAFPNGHPQFWHGSVMWEVSSILLLSPMVIPSFGMGRVCGKYHRFSGFPQWSSPVLARVGYVGSIIVLVAFPNGHPQFWHGSGMWEVSSI